MEDLIKEMVEEMLTMDDAIVDILAAGIDETVAHFRKVLEQEMDCH